MVDSVKTVTRLVAAGLVLVCLTTGCWNRKELDTLSVAIGIGIDKTSTPGRINVTTQVAIPGSIKTSENDAGASEKAYWNHRKEADNVFAALRESALTASRKLYIGQNQIVLFGEELAEEGLEEYLDFFWRDSEARMDQNIVIVKGKASGILDVEAKLEKLPALGIQKLIQLDYATAKTVRVRLSDFASCLASGITSPVAPLIQAKKTGEDPELMMSGTAVFKGDKMIGELGLEQTQGYLWIVDRLRGGFINSSMPTGKICFEILKSKSRLTPLKDEDGSFKMQLKVGIDLSVANQSAAYDMLLSEHISEVGNCAAESVERMIESSLNQARKLQADIFGFGEAIYKRYPKDWELIKKNWDLVFPMIQVEIQVEVRLRGIGEIDKFIQPEEG
jgi:spore germination protein KC